MNLRSCLLDDQLLSSLLYITLKIKMFAFLFVQQIQLLLRAKHKQMQISGKFLMPKTIFVWKPFEATWLLVHCEIVHMNNLLHTLLILVPAL